MTSFYNLNNEKEALHNYVNGPGAYNDVLTGNGKEAFNANNKLKELELKTNYIPKKRAFIRVELDTNGNIEKFDFLNKKGENIIVNDEDTQTVFQKIDTDSNTIMNLTGTIISADITEKQENGNYVYTLQNISKSENI